MKPETPTPHANPEQFTAQPERTIEYAPNDSNPEVGVGRGAERREQQSESGAITSDAGITTILPAPVVDDDSVVFDTSISDMPLVANDDDLIEKEWVDRAKKIVEETKDDPYRQEQAVSKLQVDYLKKRYGRELGAAE
ncbi:MAG TPA: hypothetical protein VFS65_01395 [Candidatus Saccharimonadales bacterium]|nr:hypothetical protein [Candidatus Saccharimonadales bacterium]